MRKLSAYELALPEVYSDAVSGGDLTYSLYPERMASVVNSWTKQDPRVEWLLDFMQSVKPEKILLICASARTAQELGEVIRTQTGIRHSVFHEGMSIVERDKAAHYFADEEDGAQILLCSEIGSEGRNFQFAHHLVLFDLPITPDLLEQRIGRLDRIGQTQNRTNSRAVFSENRAARITRLVSRRAECLRKDLPHGLWCIRRR